MQYTLSRADNHITAEFLLYVANSRSICRQAAGNHVFIIDSRRRSHSCCKPVCNCATHWPYKFLVRRKLYRLISTMGTSQPRQTARCSLHSGWEQVPTCLVHDDYTVVTKQYLDTHTTNTYQIYRLNTTYFFYIVQSVHCRYSNHNTQSNKVLSIVP